MLKIKYGLYIIIRVQQIKIHNTIGVHWSWKVGIVSGEQKLWVRWNIIRVKILLYINMLYAPGIAD